ncbi:MAG: single-stranded DNA-binding protein [Firmicutes bacterium ML8_F2]|jgi:single-strand DNA-binding protein|nr:MAG: single-stranded DNA-binding protein [Firmicutes bacterium ML8_F2]
MLNMVVLIGRLTRDPELRYTPGNGVPVSTFTLAVNRPFTNQQGERDTDFINVVTWRKLAENCANYLKKGSMAAATGRLQIRSYDDSQGVRRKVAEVVANDVRFLDKGGGTDKDKNDDFDESGSENNDISEDDVPF